jgi:hypothetical protein
MGGLNATFWSFAPIGPYLALIPYTVNPAITGPYLWSSAGADSKLRIPAGAPGCRVGSTVGQFLMLGDLFRQQTVALFTGTGSLTSYSGALSGPVADGGTIFDANGALTGTMGNGAITGTGDLSSGTIDYATGDITLTFSTAPPSGDVVSAKYTQVAPYRVWWSGIGDPTSYPTPFTDAALAAESSYEDLNPDSGQVMFIAGYPLYALIFQRFGITRANYIGGNDVFDFAPYEFTHGVVAHGAAVQVNNTVFFLADDGFFVTDGANVYPVGTDIENSKGIDNWLWANLNMNALEAIRAGYDATKRCVFFAIPTGTNTLPDTLLSYNPLAKKWTRSLVACETIWSADNGTDAFPPTRQLLGIIDLAHTPNTLSGAPLTGYLESADLYFVDGVRRLTVGVRPNVSASDDPLCTVGVRDSLQNSVSYGTSTTPDGFTGIADALSSGLYTRVRIQSDSATALKGGTLYLEQDTPV